MAKIYTTITPAHNKLVPADTKQWYNNTTTTVLKNTMSIKVAILKNDN